MDYCEMTAHELHDLLNERKITSEELVKAHIEKIDKIDCVIDAYLERTNENALKTARMVDSKIIRGEEIGALEGIPAAFKDNLCTDGVKTTCASKMLENFIPPYDAYTVQKIKAQNSPVLGKTNMDEFAMGSSTETSYFKKTKNPYDITKIPGGSSGGSAAAVSAGMAVYALGSDTGGSIRQPASFCGVVGLKPTYGLVSRYGCVAFASSFDQVGPITKDVTDCANVLTAIAGYDKQDSTSLNIPSKDYTVALNEDVRGLKIGVAVDYLEEGINAEVKNSILSAVDTFASLGAETSEYKANASDYAIPAYYLMSSAEASTNLARFDGIRYGYRAENRSGLNDLYEKSRSEGFGTEVKRRILVGTYALSSGYYDAYYKKALKVRTIICEDFKKQFQKFDLLVTPVSMTTAFKFGSASTPAEMYLNDICTVSVNIAGLPAISIPCGFNGAGMPIGLQLIAPGLGEETLLKAAYAFEKNTDFHKRRPNFKGGERA